MPENQNIEWKAKWKDDYLEWICGFANAQGGKIYIGCDDDGKVIGLPNIRKLLEDVPNKIRNAMSIVVDVNQLERDGKEYLEIVVPPYPVAINCKGVYYYRSGSTMQTLSGPELESFILRKRGASWDNMPLPGFTLDDIDDELVKRFKTLAAKKGRIDQSVLDEDKADLMTAGVDYSSIKIRYMAKGQEQAKNIEQDVLEHEEQEQHAPVQTM